MGTPVYFKSEPAKFSDHMKEKFYKNFNRGIIQNEKFEACFPTTMYFLEIFLSAMKTDQFVVNF